MHLFRFAFISFCVALVAAVAAPGESVAQNVAALAFDEALRLAEDRSQQHDQDVDRKRFAHRPATEPDAEESGSEIARTTGWAKGRRCAVDGHGANPTLYFLHGQIEGEAASMKSRRDFFARIGALRHTACSSDRQTP